MNFKKILFILMSSILASCAGQRATVEPQRKTSSSALAELEASCDLNTPQEMSYAQVSSVVFSRNGEMEGYLDGGGRAAWKRSNANGCQVTLLRGPVSWETKEMEKREGRKNLLVGCDGREIARSADAVIYAGRELIGLDNGKQTWKVSGENCRVTSGKSPGGGA